MSTTKNLGLFKHDNPATNTDMFDVDKALNQNWNKTDKAFGEDRERLDLLEASNTIYNFKGKVDTLANLQSKTKKQGDVWYCIADSTYYTYTGTDWIPVNLNLKLGVIDELKAKTIKCLQEVETPTPVSGTSIDLTDSAEAKINELKISGNSKQETREGYNKLPNNATTTNISGVDFTVNKDGTVLVNGTSTANAILQLNNGTTYSAGTYKLSGCPKGGATDTYRFDLMNKANNNIPVIDIGNGSEFTITEETTFVPRIRIQSGTTINNLLFEPMLVNDTSKTKYEQYGASPSPDYPSEIECCGDNINMFNKNDITNNTSIDVKNGNTYTDNNSFSTNFIKIKGIIELCCNGLSDTSKLWGAIYDENKNFIKGISTTNEIFNETNLSGVTYIRLGILKKYLDTTKIEKGTTPTQYSKYGQGCINEVICNKNTFDGEVELGTFDANGSIVTNTNCVRTKNFQQVNSNKQYTISNNLNYQAVVQLYDKDKNFIKALGNVSTFITTTDTKYVKWRSSLNNNESNLNVKYQLEEGSSATSYVPHEEQVYTIPTQQPFRSNGDIRDTFIKKNNKWYERHYIPRIIFDGSETWYGTISSGWSQNEHVFGTAVSGVETNGQSTNVGKVLLSSHFECDNTGVLVSHEKNCISYYPAFKNGSIMINHQGISSVTDIKAWLSSQYNAGTPVYVDYVLKEPLDIECTEEQSTILFDIEQNAKTYKNITHIYSTDNVSANIEVTYKKDIETLFANTLVEGV